MLWNRAGKIFLILSLLGVALVILLFSEPPLFQDYPDWVYQGALFAKMLTGHPVAGYTIKLYPVPNSITTVGLGLLTLVFGWQLAAKLWVLIYLVLAAFTSFYAASVFKVKDAGLWWVLPITLFVGRLFWLGTISFNIGVCFLLLIACELYRGQDRTLLMGALLLVCFFVHLIVYAGAILMMLFYCLQYRRWKLMYMGLATVVMVFWYFAGRILTHSTESRYGNARPSHFIIPILVTLILLAVSFFTRRSVHRVAGRWLIVLAGLIVGSALAGGLFSAHHLSAGLLSNIFLLQEKALQPFMLFGFINIVSMRSDGLGVSATLNLYHEPLYVALMALTLFAGAVVLVDLSRTMIASRRQVDESPEVGNKEGFLWDFLILFGFLYIVCPPNLLGVTSIDLRFVQLSLAIALFLLAQKTNSMLRVAAFPCALLMISGVYLLGVSQYKVHIPGRRMLFAPVIDYAAAADPSVRSSYYDALRSGHLDLPIFESGIFTDTGSHR